MTPTHKSSAPPGKRGLAHHRTLWCLSLIVPSILFAALPARAQSPWPTLHGSPARAAAATVKGPLRPSLFWKLPFVQYVNAVFRSPVSTADRRLVTSVFASNPDGTAESRLLRAQPDGAVQVVARDLMFGDPTVGPTGDLYVLGIMEDEYRFIIFPAEGDPIPLALPPNRPVFNSPAVGPDGAIFLGLNGLVIGLNPKGEPLWVWAHPQLGDPTQPQPTVLGSPAVGPDGTLYVVFQDALYAFETNAGGLVWRSNYLFVDADRPADGPAVAPDGTIYVITRTPTPAGGGEGESFLYSLRPAGGLNWRWPAGRGAIRRPAVAPDGTVYVSVSGLRLPNGARVGRVHALNPDSTPRRPPVERPEAQGMVEDIVLDSDGVIYGTAPLGADTLIVGLRPDGTNLFPPTPVPGRLRGPLGLPQAGLVSALTDRGVVLLADGPVLDLTMAVSAPQSAPFQTLTYTIRVRNLGRLPATNLLVRSTVPDETNYVPGSTTLDGRPIADLGETSPLPVGVNVGLLAPGAEAVLTFRATVRPTVTGARMTNSATARSDQLGTHVSNTVTTNIN